MKKIVSTLLILYFLIFLPISSFAKGLLLNYDGSIHKYPGSIYTLKINEKIIASGTPPVIINNRMLVPVRAAFESLGASAKWDASAKKFYIVLDSTKLEFKANSSLVKMNNKTIKIDTTAKLINDRLFIPVSFFTQSLNMTVSQLSNKNLITIDKKIVSSQGKLESIKYTLKDKKCEVLIYLSNYQAYKTMTLSNPDRIVIDINNVTLKAVQENINIKSNFIKSIRYSQLDAKTVRVVLDVIAQVKYDVIKNNNQLIINVTDNRPILIDRGGEIDRNDSLQDVITNIQHISNYDNEEVNIFLDDYKDYIDMLTDNPYQIVLKIPGKVWTSEPKVYNFNGTLVQSAQYSQLDTNTIKLEINLKLKFRYYIYEEKGYLNLRIVQIIEVPEEQNSNPSTIVNIPSESTVYKNINYTNVGDRVSLTINNLKLTEGGGTLKKLYNDGYDETGNKYTISFPSSFANFDNGIIKIDDSIVEFIEILKVGDITNIIFNSKEKFYYNVFSRSELKDTVITILKPATKEDKLIVIDPGHGGYEPGAVYANVYEKDLNLDIAQRLNTLLRNQNIKTYILRDEDIYLGLYERTNIANNLNAALFLSIHNNAYTSSFKGTETLYNYSGADNGSFNSKKFAQTIQTNLIRALGTVDRKIVYRPNLVVLKGTSMYAALAEIGFITNEIDRINLLNPDFRQKAAAALAESLIQSLAMLNN